MRRRNIPSPSETTACTAERATACSGAALTEAAGEGTEGTGLAAGACTTGAARTAEAQAANASDRSRDSRGTTRVRMREKWPRHPPGAQVFGRRGSRELVSSPDPPVHFVDGTAGVDHDHAILRHVLR